MSSTNLEQLKAAVKSVMKRQKKSYQELADHLGLSLVSVKRIMSKEEITLSRFLEICDWLDTSLAELEKISRYNQTHKKLHFSSEQELFLAKNTEYLAFLFNLYADESPEQIQKKYSLSTKSLNLYLLRLERHNLIKKVSGRCRPVFKEFPSPIPYGELSRSQYKNVLETGASFFRRFNTQMILRKDPEADRGSNTLLAVMGVSRESYLAWLEKYRNLYQELVNISEVEDKIEALANKRSVVLMHLHAVLDENHIEIEGIKNMFGRPVELK